MAKFPCEMRVVAKAAGVGDLLMPRSVKSFWTEDLEDRSQGAPPELRWRWSITRYVPPRLGVRTDDKVRLPG